MINFSDAQMLGANDKAFQNQYNYLVELVSTYLTRGMLQSVNENTYIDLGKNRFQFMKDANNYIKWDGETFEVKGKITVTSGTATRTFVAEPTTPYKIGDIWMQGGTGNILVCTTSRETGAYNSDDWEVSSKYTDDTLAATKTKTFYQSFVPTSTAIGDLWVDTDDDNVIYRAESVGADGIATGEWVKMPFGVGALGDTVIDGGYIKTNLLTADNIITGKLQDSDGSTYFDLDSAEIVVRSYTGLLGAYSFFSTSAPAHGTNISAYTGEEVSSDYHFTYTFDQDLIGKYTKINFTKKTDYEYKVYAYDFDDAFIGPLSDWETESSLITLDHDGYIKVVIHNVGNTNISTWSYPFGYGIGVTPSVKVLMSPTSPFTVTAGTRILFEIDNRGYVKTSGININDELYLTNSSPTTSAATHYYVETGSGSMLPKTLANVKSEIVTKAAVEATLTGAITSHTHSYVPIAGGASRKVIYLTTGDCNTITEEWTVIHPDVSNAPATGYWYMQTILMATGDNRQQIAYKYNGSDMYRRYYYSSSWSSWSKIF